ncbi:hypothetical protein B0H13DRAFT_2546096 [Mycena leptocephala]|nr:hypothetical protein B0H13DRAFT_2546096 [Mycena leptocephala]
MDEEVAVPPSTGDDPCFLPRRLKATFHLQRKIGPDDANPFQNLPVLSPPSFFARGWLSTQRPELALEQLDSMVHPVLTIPPELTAEIFGAPLLLASICREWRFLALSTCALWTTIRHVSRKTKNPKKLVESWLSRAGDLPLDLSMDARGLKSAPEILAILAQRSSRWQNLKLIWSQTLPFPNESLRGRLSSLKTLHFEAVDWFSGYIDVTAFLEAPLLREASLGGLSLVQIPLPWSQLTGLDLFSTGKTCEKCCDILVQTTKLEELHVWPAFHSFVVSHCILPCLKNFALLGHRSLSERGNSALLRYLTVPALKHLVLEYIPPGVVEDLQSLIGQSECCVETLVLSFADFDVMHGCIHIIPLLRELTLKTIGWSKQKFEILFGWMAGSADPAGGADTPSLLALECFSLEDCGSDLPLDALATMLSVRWADRKIKAFSLKHDIPVSPDVAGPLEQLRELGRQGMKLDIRPELISP